MMNKYITLFILLFLAFTIEVNAGNPDRQGEAGAYELLLNPWARNSGVHGLVTGSVRGIESVRINVAGLAYTNQTELVFARTNYLQGTNVFFNAVGIGQRISKNGVFGVTLMSVDFGDINITTTDQPEGIGATYKPAFFNLGLAYAHKFSDRISGGVTVRLVSEQVTNVSAQGVAFDAGIMYATGNVKFGISLRNIGTPMKFDGDGISFGSTSATGVPLTIDQRISSYELPSLLNIGGAYDFLIAEGMHRVTVFANFTSNSFTKDQYGIGLEYSLNDNFMIRGAYKYEDGLFDDSKRTNVYTGLSAGATIELPVKKGSETTFGIDYSYRASNPFGGTHSIGVRFNL